MQFGYGELNIFFHFSVVSSIVVGVVILVVLGVSKAINDYLESWEYLAVGVALFLILSSLSLWWLKRKMYDEFAELKD